MDEKISALIEANSAYENAQTLLPVLSEVIPKQAEALDLVSQINNLATEKKVTLSSLQMTNVPLTSSTSSANPKNIQPHAELPITFNVEGAYSSIVEFLKELVAMRRLTTIPSMNFVPVKPTVLLASESAKPSSIKVSINLLGYYETK